MSEDGGGVVASFLKALFGDVPIQWVRLVLLGSGITIALVMLRDFRRDMQAESAAVRGALTEYIASNTAWQNSSTAQRERLLKRVNTRIARLYKIHNIDYYEVEP